MPVGCAQLSNFGSRRTEPHAAPCRRAVDVAAGQRLPPSLMPCVCRADDTRRIPRRYCRHVGRGRDWPCPLLRLRAETLRTLPRPWFTHPLPTHHRHRCHALASTGMYSYEPGSRKCTRGSRGQARDSEVTGDPCPCSRFCIKTYSYSRKTVLRAPYCTLPCTCTCRGQSDWRKLCGCTPYSIHPGASRPQLLAT